MLIIPDVDSHNLSDQSALRSTPYSNFKDEQTELDELVHGMLKEIQSIPDAPVYSSLRPFTSSLTSQPTQTRHFSNITTTTTIQSDFSTPKPSSVPTSIISVNGTKQVVQPGSSKPDSIYTVQKHEVFIDDEEDGPYHARKSTSPFTYLAQSPVHERRRLLSDGHQPLELQERHTTYADSLRYKYLNYIFYFMAILVSVSILFFFFFFFQGKMSSLEFIIFF